jgi:glucokinase
MSDTCLVADIGGTNARFALALRERDSFQIAHRIVEAASEFARFEDALAHALSTLPTRPNRASFAVAGPIRDGQVRFTNSQWSIDANAVAQRFGFNRVVLENDFAGQARGALHVPRTSITAILSGHALEGAPVAVLGPGTGLGLAYVMPMAHGAPRIVATEGGHTAFAPQTSFEAEILKQLQNEHGYVSFERVASGIGIASVYRACLTIAGLDAIDRSAAEIVARIDQDAQARSAMNLFFSALGVFAGNAVLMGGARGGVMLGGGILPKVRAQLAQSDFAERFRARGAMSAYLAECPVDLIMSDDTALLGAAAFGFD